MVFLTASMARGESLAGDLSLMERDTFDTNKYIRAKCPAMSEKGIKKLRSELADLKKAFVFFSRGDVHSEYGNFVKATRDISGLETSLFKVRNLLSNQVAIIHGLLEQPLFSMDMMEDDETQEEEEEEEQKDQEYIPSDWEKRVVALLDKLEVLLGERKIEDAVLHIKEGDKLFLRHGGPEEPHAEALRVVLSCMKRRLVEEVVEATERPSIRCSELRSAASVLRRLGEGSKAHSLILASHHTRVVHKMKGLTRSSSYGGAYTAALSQLVFSSIAQALKDSVAVFGTSSGYNSEFMVWSRQLAEKLVMLLKKHVLSSAAAAGGLRAAGECVMIALGHCALLEKEGVALCPLLSRLLKPSIEQAVNANLKRIGESTLALAAADKWSISDPYQDGQGGGRRPSRGGDGVHLRLTSSALKFNAMIEDFLSGLAPLVKFQLASSVFQSLSDVYQQYVTFLVRALPISEPSQGSWEAPDRTLKPAETLAQQLAIVGNASAVAKEILPGVVRKLQLHHNAETNQMEAENAWKKELDQSFENVRMIVCKVLLRDIIFDRRGKLLVTSQMYSNDQDEAAWFQEPLPSQVFQELFSRVSSIAKTGEEVLRGQEDVCKLLITELLQTVVSCILNNKDFWVEMEEGPTTFTTLGLQKFVLDMQFVVHFASEGHYASETIYKLLAELIALATNAFALNGGDPMGVLPEDQWFVEASQAAFMKLAYT